MPIGIATEFDISSIIAVVGVGGGGGNAINNMIESGFNNVLYLATNTDKQALDKNKAPYKVQLGDLGAGGKPEIGEKAAKENLEKFNEFFKNVEMVFITAGMGGGTGTGAAPVIAKYAKDMGKLVVGIVTKPFEWEGKARNEKAKEGIAKLRECVDALIVIPNQKLLEIVNSDVSFIEAFKKVDDVLLNATKGISDIISNTGIVNVDFADVKSIMSDMGDAIMGVGRGTGQDRAKIAANNAIHSPLLDGITIRGSKGVLINITGNANLTMTEVSAAVSLIRDEVGNDANIIHGVVINDDLKDEIVVTVVATGFKNEQPKPKIENIKLNGIDTKSKTNNTQYKAPIVNPPFYEKNLKEEQTVEIPILATIESNDVPKGEENLKKFDIPAIIRKQGFDVSNYGADIMARYQRNNHNNFTAIS
jgi:cell division protein FtsZ